MGVTHARDAFSRHVRGREDEDDRRLGRSVGHIAPCPSSPAPSATSTTRREAIARERRMTSCVIARAFDATFATFADVERAMDAARGRGRAAFGASTTSGRDARRQRSRRRRRRRTIHDTALAHAG